MRQWRIIVQIVIVVLCSLCNEVTAIDTYTWDIETSFGNELSEKFKQQYPELIQAALKGEFLEVNRLLIEVEKSDPEPSVEDLTCLTKIALAVGSRDIAERYLARMEKKVPDTTELLATKSFFFFKQCKYSEALELLDLLLTQHPNDPRISTFVVLRAECLFFLGDEDRALNDIREMLARNPNDAETIFQHNQFLLQLFASRGSSLRKGLPLVLEGLQAMRYCENFDELSLEKQSKYMFCRTLLSWMYITWCYMVLGTEIDYTMMEVYQESTIPTESVVLSITNGEPIHWEIKDPKLITSDEEWLLTWSENIMCDLDFIVYSPSRTDNIFKEIYPLVIQIRKDIFETRGDSKRIEEDQMRLQKHLRKIDTLNRQEDQMETERRLKQIRNTPVPIREF